MKKINIVLYSPEIPQNTGNISRTCACTGAALHIIKPCGFEITDRNLKRAGLDYWDNLEIYYYDNYEHFLDENKDGVMYYFSSHGKTAHTDINYQDNVYLIFGKESVGLDKELVDQNYDMSVRIPMRPLLRCLNLSNSVAIACYEVLRQWDFAGME